MDADYDGTILSDDEGIEVSAGGIVCVPTPGCTNCREEIVIQPIPAPYDGYMLLAKNDPSNRVEIYRTQMGGSPIQFNDTDNRFNFSTEPISLWVQGVTNSASLRDVALTLTSYPQRSVDRITFTVLRMGLVPDFNHDRTIDNVDESLLSTNGPFRFWINDDDDFGDVAEADSDVPGQNAWLDQANCDDGHVNGRCDLLDFFPVWLDLNQMLNLLPPSGTVQYRLRQTNGAVRGVYTDLNKDQAGDFLTTDGTTYGPSFNQNSYEADTFKVTSSGVTLPTNFLGEIKNDACKGVLLVEGARATTNSLILEVWKGGAKVCEKEMPLSVDGVEKMYRWINLRGAAGGPVGRPTDTNEPANYPDSLCNGKHLIFVHGYSCHEEAARAWNAEIFKRLYQSGSRAMFTGVAWFGNEGQVPGWIPFVGGSTPDYYVNVEHAFETASNMVAMVSGLPGQKCIAAHSLGNMLVSAAIKDCGLSVNAYFMLDAAAAMEAHDETASNLNDMRHPDWQDYSNRLWTAEWYRLFPTDDGRHEVTWRGRFGNISVAYNYYSSTEDVLDNGDGDLHTPLASHWAWYNQEVRKGTTLMWLAPGNCEGGWGFNGFYTNEYGFVLPPSRANLLTDDDIRANSFFAWFDDENLYGANGGTVAQQPAIHRRLLADAIPALSFAMGRNDLSGFGAGAVDMYLLENGWPEERLDDDEHLDHWLHSDIKNVAYPFTFTVFDDVVQKGGLH